MSHKDDDSCWQEALRGVKPLRQGGRRKRQPDHNDVKVHKSESLKPFFSGSESSKEELIEPNLTVSDYSHTLPRVVVESNESNRISGFVQSIDTKTRQKLKKGQVQFSQRIDLHGLYVQEAWEALMDFLRSAPALGVSCALVIHGKGKGYGADGDMGAIKAQIAGWLAGHPVVIGFHSALPKDGGTGALYVLIRKSKE